MSNWIKSKLPYVEYRIDKNRPKVGVNFDRYYRVRFKALGKTHVIVLGHWSANWTEQIAYNKAEYYKANIKAGQRPQSWKEEEEILRAKAEVEEKRKKQEEMDNLTFGQVYDEYYKPHAEANKTAKTVKTEDWYYKKWLKPELKDKSLKKIAPFDLERIKKNMQDNGKSAQTIEHVLGIVRLVYNRALNMGLHQGENPYKKVKIPKEDSKRIRYMDYDEAECLLEALKRKEPELHDISLIALDCAPRANEILNLQWQDINFAQGLVTFRHTKNGKVRHIPMTDRVKAMLEQRYDNAMCDYVFHDQGKKLPGISHRFGRVIKALKWNDGVEDRRQKVVFHTLRHTAASWLVMAGVPLFTVKEFLGHAQISQTERYSHLAPDNLQQATNVLNGINGKDKRQQQGKVVNLNS